jgi:hypothetical protein
VKLFRVFITIYGKFYFTSLFPEGYSFSYGTLQDFDDEMSEIEFKLDSVLDSSMWPRKEITSFAKKFCLFGMLVIVSIA